VVDLQTGKSYSVATEKDGCRLGHCWSPDGKRIAYGWRQQIENRMQDEEVFLMVVDADGGNLSVLHSEKSFFPGLFVTGWR
jgi:putative hemolysin